MRALVKFQPGAGNVELREVDEPVCADDQVKLEVGFCGICGTDLHVFSDTFRNFPPVILGHEFAGTIIETGRNVRKFQPGDRVTVLGATTITCGKCAYCRKGEFMFCSNRRGMGHGVNGAFTRYVVAREDQLFKLPESLTLEEGAMAEPFAVAVHAVCEITPLRLGDVAVISGPGPIGLLCLKLLVSQGVKTIVAGTRGDGQRLAIAQRIGASRIVNVEKEDLVTVVKKETDGLGVDLALECAGAAASAANCLEALRPLGHYTQVGHFGRAITVAFDRIGFKQLRVSGSVGYTAESWTRALKILDLGKVQLGDLITHKLSLADWKRGFDLCREKEALKVLLSPNHIPEANLERAMQKSKSASRKKRTANAS